MKTAPKAQRDFEIDLGLEVLCCIVKPGERVTHRAFAAACNRSHGWAVMAEIRIMKKVRHRLRTQLHASYVEFMRIETRVEA